MAQRRRALGYSQPIACNGVFPTVQGPQWEEEAANNLARQFEGWASHPSADEGQEDLEKLINEAQSKGFISVFDTMEALGLWPVLNKLGLIIKIKGDKRKARLIWDLRESGVNDHITSADGRSRRRGKLVPVRRKPSLLRL